MNTFRRIAAVPIATIGLFANGCVSPSDTFPEEGIVIEKYAEEVDGDCAYNLDNICISYYQETEYRLVIADCRRAAGGIIEIANDEYLHSHIEHPTDYPIVSNESIDLDNDGQRLCQDTKVVDEDTYQDTRSGDLFTNS